MDDSIHDAHGFLVLSFVFSDEDLEPLVRNALAQAGLDPDRDEFKSGARMAGNSKMQQAREGIADVVAGHTEIGVVVGTQHGRFSRGQQCLQALQSMLIRNGIAPADLEVHVDEGIFANAVEGETVHSMFRFLAGARLFASEKSHLCAGIQCADLVAHTVAQVIREGLSERPRLVGVDGSRAEPGDEEAIPLSTLLVGRFRHSILARSGVPHDDAFDPATDPVILNMDDDREQWMYGQHPEAVGWGVQIAQDVSDKVRDATFKMLYRVWLGCSR